MGQYRRKRKYTALSQCLIWGLAAAATLPGVLAAAVLSHQLYTAMEDFVTQAAVFSALYTVPDQALEHLHRRFDEREDEVQEAEPPEPMRPPAAAELPQTQEQPDTAEQPTQKPEPMPPPSQQPQELPEIPEGYRGTIVEENLAPVSGSGCLSLGKGLIKNTTELSNDEVQACLDEPDSMRLDGDGPQVLIMHTHATESFEPYDASVYDTRHHWRSTDNRENIVAAGQEMAQAIRAHGIEVLHDETQHDYPSYNGSYERSAQTVRGYLEQYPSIKVVLDVHRDAVQRGDTLVKPVTSINGKKAAQLMMIAGCDDGTMGLPNWRKNLRFAAGLQDAIESRWQGLTRPVFFCYRKYNQDLTNGSLLLELGSHGNTLEEVLYTARLAGDAIGAYLEERNG